MLSMYNAIMNKTLSTLNTLAREQRVFTTVEFREHYGGTAQSAANALSRAIRDGVVERVARGRYAIRELGRLATHASTEDILLALSPIVAGRDHRIAYLTALEYHSLLLYPQSEVQLAVSSPTRYRKVSGRRLRPVVELPEFLEVGAIEVEHDCRVSNMSRSLIDAARRLDLIGGVDVVADALRLAQISDVSTIVEYAQRLDAYAALRRLGSIARAVGQEGFASAIHSQAGISKTPIPVDPSNVGEAKWVDQGWNVAWDPLSADLIGLPVNV